MDSNIKQLCKNVDDLKKHLGPLNNIYKRYISLNTDSIFKSEYEKVEGILFDMYKRVNVLKEEVVLLKNIFELTTTQVNGLLCLDNSFDNFVNLYMEMATKIENEKKDQEKIKNRLVQIFYNFVDLEIECDHDSLTTILWKDWMEYIKWREFKGRMFSN